MLADLTLPYIAPFDENTYYSFVERNFSHSAFLAKEERRNFSGEFAHHNRFFSNGDRPLVAVVKLSGSLKLTYEGKDYEIPNDHYVFFDDNVHHSWNMKEVDILIFYHRQDAQLLQEPVTTGDYCIDSQF